MLTTLIKNNFKLMFRNKLVILLAILGPVIVIAALSSAFHDLLNTSYDTAGFSLGYAIDEASPLAPHEDAIVKLLKNEDISCNEYTANLAEESVKKQNVDVFLKSSKDKCVIYSQNPDGIESRICQYIIQQFNTGMQLQKLSINSTKPLPKITIHETALPTQKTASASDYYGIIEVVYFIWICMIFLSPIIQSERKNHIQSRFIISPATNIRLYLGKFIPCVLTGCVCTAISIAISSYLYDIHWGNPIMSCVILFCTTLAATAFGLLCLYVFNNLAVSVIFLFIITWFAGFLGGSFETYMYSSFPDFIKELSPFYYINRTLVEYSTHGVSDYTIPCIIFLSCILLISGILGLLLMKRRMEEL